MGSWWGAQEAQRGPCDRAHTAMIGRPEPGTIGQPPGGLYVDAPPHRRRSGPPPLGGRHSSNITCPLCPRDGHGLQLWPLTADYSRFRGACPPSLLIASAGHTVPSAMRCQAAAGDGQRAPALYVLSPCRSGRPCRGADGPAARRARINETPGR